jgi:hypothetical protein
MGFRSKRVAAAARMSPTARTPRSFIVLVLETERVTEVGRPQTTLDLTARRSNGQIHTLGHKTLEDDHEDESKR